MLIQKFFASWRSFIKIFRHVLTLQKMQIIFRIARGCVRKPQKIFGYLRSRRVFKHILRIRRLHFAQNQPRSFNRRDFCKNAEFVFIHKSLRAEIILNLLYTFLRENSINIKNLFTQEIRNVQHFVTFVS